MMNFFSNIFGYVLNAIYMLLKNYGLAILLFSVIVKVLMLPLSIRQQKTLKKNEKIQKEMKILQIKYKDNPEMLNSEVMQLYRREKINPLGGCFNIIIQFILLIAVFYLVRSPLTYMKKIDKDKIDSKIIEIKEENGEDSINKNYPEISVIKYIQEKDLKDDEMYINMNFLGLDLSKIPQENFQDFRVFIIPILYVISSAISIKVTAMSTTSQNGENAVESKELISQNDKKEMDQAQMTAQMNKTMTWFMPILAVSISLVAPLGLALYWLLSNIFMIVERILLSKFVSKEDEENA